MSKEYLEALERGIIEFEKNLEDDPNNEWLKRTIAGMKKCYQRLEAIDNANPSEALIYLDQFMNEMTRCLENPKQYAKNYNKEIFWKYKNTFETTIKQALLKAQEQEKVIIELCEYCGMDNLYPYDNLEEIKITFKDTFDNYQLQRITSLGRLNKLDKLENENAELKRVLEIIKEKSDLSALEMANDVNEFNEMTFNKEPYTQEEFDLLKRWLEDEHTPSK